MFKIQAACGCNIGKIRKNNEDNFYFNGRHLKENNSGLEQVILFEDILKNGFCVAVFDGMGGENFGETASFVASHYLQTAQKDLTNIESDAENHLERLLKKLDKVVVDTQQQMLTNKMGTTMVGLFYVNNTAYICNVGDSRAYLLRDGKLTQLSCDHIEKRQISSKHKAPLTQYLGFGFDDIEIEPYIYNFEIESNDTYLLCSDGLSDMLEDSEIKDILSREKTMTKRIETLIGSAIKHGGRDNITIIICQTKEN